tara:strand:+ start:21910 stop:22284 length:375 start_codon:yes stop_codon:yes gene_type:complete
MGKINKKRHTIISDKLFKMAEALILEGDESGDYIIQSTGNFIMLLSGIMGNARDMKTVSDLLAMFSAKKVLDDQMMSSVGSSDLEDIFKQMRDSLENEQDDEYYDDDDEDYDDDNEDDDPNGWM